MWVIQKLVRWDSLEVYATVLGFGGLRTTPTSPDHSPGFMPIFDTLEAALEWERGDPAHIREIRAIESTDESDGREPTTKLAAI